MGNSHYDRLSAFDAMFLEIEDANTPMHTGSVGLFDAGSLRSGDAPEGSIDFERVRVFAEAQLHKNPRFRQRLASIPAFDRPVWIDDPRFNLLYHLRHTALPHPGGIRQLKRLAGRLLSQQLDRRKPLWEMWFIEGLEGDRFAVLSKIHHCIADGVSSGDLMNMLMGRDPSYVPDTSAPVWIPREAPDERRLVFDELVRRAGAPLALLGRGSGAERSSGDARSGGRILDQARHVARGAFQAAEKSLHPVTPTPLNVRLGPDRRFDWTRFDLADVKQVGRAAGGTVNDVALAVVTGAVRSYLKRRAGGADGVEFRVAVPVNMRTEADAGRLGNRASSIAVDLPIDEADPWRHLERIAAQTRELKGSGESQLVDLIGRVADVLPAGLMAQFSRFGTQSTVNMIVTNVPGPQFPLYMLGAQMRACYPVVPLMPGQALGVAMLGYDGGLFWGFNADWDAVPDLHELVLDVEQGFETLRKAAAPSAGS